MLLHPLMWIFSKINQTVYQVCGLVFFSIYFNYISMQTYLTYFFQSTFLGLKSASETSKRGQSSGTIYSVLKSLLKKENVNDFVLLNMSQLRSHLHQEGILSLVKLSEYSGKNMSNDEQAKDYLENVLTRKREDCLKFLYCLQNENEHIGHGELLKGILGRCKGKLHVHERLCTN